MTVTTAKFERAVAIRNEVEALLAEFEKLQEDSLYESAIAKAAEVVKIGTHEAWEQLADDCIAIDWLTVVADGEAMEEALSYQLGMFIGNIDCPGLDDLADNSH